MNSPEKKFMRRAQVRLFEFGQTVIQPHKGSILALLLTISAMLFAGFLIFSPSKEDLKIRAEAMKREQADVSTLKRVYALCSAKLCARARLECGGKMIRDICRDAATKAVMNQRMLADKDMKPWDAVPSDAELQVLNGERNTPD